jgi:transcriptional regulator of acetoin/glycerol metabolism
MEMLFEQIVNTESMIVLTDAQGTILHSVGDDGSWTRAARWRWRRASTGPSTSKGTNAIGTALFEEAPTLVHGGEHFMHANSFLTCSAAPDLRPARQHARACSTSPATSARTTSTRWGWCACRRA